MLFYLNGLWRRLPPGETEARRLGFGFGLGVFTTLGVRGGRPLFLEDHLRRLERNARLLSLRMSSRTVVRALMDEGLRRMGQSDGVVKIMLAGPVTRGDLSRGPERLAIAIMPARPVPPAVDLLLAPYEPTRWHAYKLTAYLDSAMLAARARAARCFDAVAVAQGELLDTSMANLFLVDRSGIKTPPADGRILPGIARARLLAAREPAICERRLYMGDLSGALCVFLTNSVRGPIPVRRVLDERRATLWQAKGRPDVPDKVRDAYRRLVDIDSVGTS